MHTPVTLSNDPLKALREIGGYLRTARTGPDRAVNHDSETLGYYQTPEWLEGLVEITRECQRITIAAENIHRWNIHRNPDGSLSICDGTHEKSGECHFIDYIPKPD